MIRVTPIQQARPSLDASAARLQPALPAAPRKRGKKHETPADVFEGMKSSFSPAKAKGVKLTFMWKISGPNGGTWHIKVNDGTCTVAKGPAKNPDVTFSCTDETWVAMGNEELGGMRAYLTRKFKVDGPMSIAKQMDVLFPH